MGSAEGLVNQRTKPGNGFKAYMLQCHH